MKKTLKRIAPLRFGIVLAIAYTLISLVAMLYMLLTLGFSDHFNVRANITSALSAILFNPILGFITGFLGAALYNLIVPWIGGIEVEVE